MGQVHDVVINSEKNQFMNKQAESLLLTSFSENFSIATCSSLHCGTNFQRAEEQIAPDAFQYKQKSWNGLPVG